MKAGIDFTGVGIGVMIVKDEQVLLLKRKNENGMGTWCFPGGRLKFNESFFECAVRETKEETGIDIQPSGVISVSNNLEYNMHYITIGVLARVSFGEPRVLDSENFVDIGWFGIYDLPAELFPATEKIISHYRGEPLG